MGLFSSIFNTITGISKQNYERQLQQQIFQREDTAVQRRVSDLKAAGLSPTLASGQGAGAGSVVNTTQPTSDLDVMGYLQSLENIGVSQAQQQLLKSQAQQAEASTALSNLNKEIAQYDYEIAKDAGLPTSADPTLQTIFSLLKEIIGDGGSGIEMLGQFVNPNSDFWYQQHDPETKLGSVTARNYLTLEGYDNWSDKMRNEFYKWKRGFGPRPAWYRGD